MPLHTVSKGTVRRCAMCLKQSNVSQITLFPKSQIWFCVFTFAVAVGRLSVWAMDGEGSSMSGAAASGGAAATGTGAATPGDSTTLNKDKAPRLTKAQELKKKLYDPNVKLVDLFGDLEPKMMLDAIFDTFWESYLNLYFSYWICSVACPLFTSNASIAFWHWDSSTAGSMVLHCEWTQWCRATLQLQAGPHERQQKASNCEWDDQIYWEQGVGCRCSRKNVGGGSSWQWIDPWIVVNWLLLLFYIQLYYHMFMRSHVIMFKLKAETFCNPVQSGHTSAFLGDTWSSPV